MDKYNEFIQQKINMGSDSGFEPLFMPDSLFDFQKYLTEWAIRKGRAAIFSDCGTGKTIMQLVWAKNVYLKTKKPVLILTPLAVSAQTIKEGAKFGIDCTRSKTGKIESDIVITNYERLQYFTPDKFSGVVCDESSILKSFAGARRSEITAFMRKTPYRLLTTATAAPNDYIELGTSSEALGNIGFVDMLSRFFKNDNNNCSIKRMFGEIPKWRLKHHAEIPFWRWVTSWAMACRKPSDLGFEDGEFILKPLKINDVLVKTEKIPEGFLFNIPASTLPEQREEKRRTIKDRCDYVLEILEEKKEQSILWCQLNDEGDYLEDVVPESVQISGSDSDDKKEEAFLGFASGQIRRLITKPKIGAWGLNFQNCNHIVMFPSHSYEQYYQSIRRCWRFGQKNPVTVDIVLTEGERKILLNLKRKAVAADTMFENLIGEMNNSVVINKIKRDLKKEELPAWL